tara:strand:+ start:16445 stop:16795 length:351 start_codon:yes stop_codon:yes gene_type:complete
MSAAERLVRGVAATLPAAIRERHREEWLADLDGASEAGIARSDVAWGAAAFALTLSRSDPAVSGMTRPALAARRARWGRFPRSDCSSPVPSTLVATPRPSSCLRRLPSPLWSPSVC